MVLGSYRSITVSGYKRFVVSSSEHEADYGGDPRDVSSGRVKGKLAVAKLITISA
jgi:hypothetical protein